MEGTEGRMAFCRLFSRINGKKTLHYRKHLNAFENAMVAEGQNNKTLAGTKHEDKRGLHSFSGRRAQGDWN